ncbi:ATP-binding protein [Lentzea flava]|uniref:SARP family transcriptional regulator n=1 Tax=Lentzea flava TaxID=103732 RepID=A0ABQ2ULJ9_9PSEU|nr:tetratricopeptide repeat protein [Lentzea flava]MCP2199887.1 Tetratricopeptide repeat-containing protein [Lentzea flava]GGU40184.1 SARP family transcriptional regulator [Lentzea flava]
MGDIRFLLLGPFVVEVDGQPIALPAGRSRDLLAILVANANEVVPLHELGDTQALRTAISRLRRALGGVNCIHTYETGYLAHVTSSDLLDFRALRDQGRNAEALTLWRGDAFEGIHAVSAAAEKLNLERRAAEALVPVPRQIPAPLPQFAGRDRELAALRESGPITLLSGAGGAGKTTLAVQWANEADFPAGQLHVNLRGFGPTAPARPEDTIRSFLSALGVPPDSMPIGTDEQEELYRTLLRGKNMLLLLDNARDADQVRPLLPDDPSCRVVITSRNRMDDLAGTTRLGIDVLSPAEARQVLIHRIGARATAEPQALSRLAARCGGLPLALAIVAARADPQHSLTALADDFASDNVLSFLDTGEETTSVRSVFDWSYQRLSGAAQRLFRLLGVHPGPDVSAAAARSLAAGDPPLAELVAANLVTETANGRFELHDLVRAYARSLVGEAEGREGLHRLLDHYLHSAFAADAELNSHRQPLAIAPPVAGVAAERLHGDDASSKWFADEIDVMIALSAVAADTRFDHHAWQLPWCLTVHMDRSGRWHEWLSVLRVALAAAQRLGDEHAAARVHHILAHACYRLSDSETRIAHLHAALRLYERRGLTDGQARIHRSLAGFYEDAGELDRALDHGRHAMALAATETERAGAMNQVGWFHGILGQHEEALDHCRRALAMHRTGGDRLGEASTLDSIAYNLHHVGDFAGAITHYRESLRVFSAIGEQFEVATTLVNLGDTYLATGQITEARQVWQEALDIYERLGHADVAKARGRLTEWTAGPSSG